ncbi:hypothetical protein BpHYR1_006070 [Brachionus plicatilis]|uniref:Uncharacterized protein n=1 Tax=Brachionus plicatilis TaxID=10195 RepID=A0A3M7RCV3_BRAPC|nr:hypothetical protein BpHYR1_006070 [Brachionus plicatilis]
MESFFLEFLSLIRKNNSQVWLAWDGLGIRRSAEASKFVKELSYTLVTSDPPVRSLARVRGYLNYYGGFAGKESPVINS